MSSSGGIFIIPDFLQQFFFLALFLKKGIYVYIDISRFAFQLKLKEADEIRESYIQPLFQWKWWNIVTLLQNTRGAPVHFRLE